MSRILRFIDGVTITMADFRLGGTIGRISQLVLVESPCGETQSNDGV
jgi:hypothetical protein